MFRRGLPNFGSMTLDRKKLRHPFCQSPRCIILFRHDCRKQNASRPQDTWHVAPVAEFCQDAVRTPHREVAAGATHRAARPRCSRSRACVSLMLQLDFQRTTFKLLSFGINYILFYAFKNVILRRGSEARPDCWRGPRHKEIQ